jgi:hypothetical protein
MELLDNYVPVIQGGATRRPGFKYVHTVYPSVDFITPSKLIPFVVSPSRAYVLEFSGGQRMRAYLNGELVLGTALVITGVSVSGAGVVTVTSVAHGLSNGNQVVISGVVGMVELNGREFDVRSVTADTFVLHEPQGSGSSAIDGTGYTAYVSGGEAAEPMVVSTTGYTLGVVFSMRWAQDRNVMYFASATKPLATLTVDDDGVFTFTAVNTSDGPYLPENETTTTLTPSAFAVGAGVTLTASSVTGINDGQGFLTTDVGRCIRVLQSNVWGWARITGWTSTTVVTIEIFNSFTSTAAKAVWRLGLWSATTGYPSVIEFHEDRLYLSGTAIAPQRIDGSVFGEYLQFSPTDTDMSVDAEEAISLILNSSDENTVRWMKSNEKAFIIGTNASPWVVQGAGDGDALSAISARARRLASEGSASNDAIRVGKSIIYVDQTSRKVNEVKYYADVEGYDPESMSDLAEHILSNGVSSLALQKDTHAVIWAKRGNQSGYDTTRQLISCTYKRRGDGVIAAWAAHTLTNALIYDLITVPIEDANAENRIKVELWMVVAREIGGENKIYIERSTPFFTTEADAEDAFFVDSGLAYDDVPATTITGLFHLEGQTVDILADGIVIAPQVVSNGSITLATAASKVTVGLNIVARAKMLRIEAGAANGTALGKTRRTHRVGIMLHRTGGFKLGPDFDNMSEIVFREADDDMDEAVPLFTGIKSEEFAANYDFENNICWEQTDPLPGTILAVMPQMVTEDR